MQLTDDELDSLVTRRGLSLPAKKIDDGRFELMDQESLRTIEQDQRLRIINRTLLEGLTHNRKYFECVARGEKGDHLIDMLTDVWVTSRPEGDHWTSGVSLTPNGTPIREMYETYPSWTVAMGRGYIDLKSSFPHVKVHFKTEERPLNDLAFATLESLIEDNPDADTFRERVIKYCDFWDQSLLRFKLLQDVWALFGDFVREEIEKRQRAIDKVIEEVTRGEVKTEEEQGYRSDWPLVRMFAKEHGADWARKWQHLPYVDISRKVMKNVLETEDDLREHVPVLSFMPWDEFILAIWGEYGRLWCHVVHEDDDIVLQFWQRDEGGKLHPMPEGIVIPDNEPWFPASESIERKMNVWREDGSVKKTSMVPPDDFLQTVSIICLSLAYLSQCPEHFVRVERRPVVAKGKEAKKQNEQGAKKPWTRQYLPSVVLLDPTKKLIDENYEKDGSIVRELVRRQPHQRRGYWRQLRDARYRRNEDGTIRMVPVRPTWIGPTEWESQGKRYRVINDEVQSLH